MVIDIKQHITVTCKLIRITLHAYNTTHEYIIVDDTITTIIVNDVFYMSDSLLSICTIQPINCMNHMQQYLYLLVFAQYV